MIVTKKKAKAWEKVIKRAVVCYLQQEHSVGSDEYEELMNAIGDLRIDEMPSGVVLSLKPLDDKKEVEE